MKALNRQKKMSTLYSVTEVTIIVEINIPCFSLFTSLRVFATSDTGRKRSVSILYILVKVVGTVQVSKKEMQRKCVCIKPKRDLRQ